MNNNKDKNQDQKPKGQLNTFARFSGLGFQMIAIIGIGSFIGVKLDEKYPNKHNLYTIILSLISVILAIVFIIRRIIAASKDDK
ncbi:MAG: AtpZ/AtpI family protein [Flavobacteriaceae bacterium]|nr:AtpZ/AtpI family protein [Flavobacteriaceae bacterium]